MFRILESQAPAKQTATDTISTLSSRLQSATLLEDRRAAILGLRSFAKIYPASVASGALRGLISSLNNDAEDVDTAKVILETLLMLFNPDESSPEASDEIALWLADEFTQRQDNITVLLDFLNNPDFYSRLYSLQLISAISTARPELTQQCVYTAPLGVTRLVAVLDDSREAVRSEGLLLLTALTSSSPDLQKLVAFENAFDRIFNIIDLEGALSHGGIIVQDCLSFLANLLRLNISNQSYFRETGWIPKLSELLQKFLQQQDPAEGIPDWARPQCDKNVWGLLSVIRLFLVRGGLGTQANQMSLWHHGVLGRVLEIAFQGSTDIFIRAEALLTCADVIRGNSKLQEGFAQLDIVLPRRDLAAANSSGENPKDVIHRVNVIQGLLELALTTSSGDGFDARLAACECIKAYLYSHTPIRVHFLRRAIGGHISDEDEIDNILTILIEDSEGGRGADPYRPWIAAVLLFNLLHEDHDAKSVTMSVTEGDHAKGEEVVTCIQAISGNLISGAQRGDDERISVGYLMVLCAWLFEDPEAVNDLLGEGSNIQSLVQLVLQDTRHQILVPGLCAFLLGIIYEFSTKDSPVPRATLYQILITRLGREQYTDKITKLREHPYIRDFEVLPQRLGGPSVAGLPNVYFDRAFVDFLKDNFSRIIRAVERDPGMEIPVLANGVLKGISRELVDSLKAQLEDRSQALQKAESDIVNLERRLGQEQADHRKSKESGALELGRIKNINEGLQKNHEEDLQKILEDHNRALSTNQQSHQESMKKLEKELLKVKEDSEVTAQKVLVRNKGEVDDLKDTIQSLKAELEKAGRDHSQDLQTAHEEYSTNLSALQSRLIRAEDKANDAEILVKRAEARVHNTEAEKTEAREALRNTENAYRTAQTELDDVLMVLQDLEEKRDRDKKHLKTLGGYISDDEVENDNDEEDVQAEKDQEVE